MRHTFKRQKTFHSSDDIFLMEILDFETKPILKNKKTTSSKWEYEKTENNCLLALKSNFETLNLAIIRFEPLTKPECTLSI